MKKFHSILLIGFILFAGFLGLYLYQSSSQKSLTNNSESMLLNNYPIQEGIPTHSLEWETRWGSNYEGIGYDVAIDDNDNVYFAGQTYNLTTSSLDAFLAKYDSEGNLIWNVIWGDSNRNETATAVAIDANNSIYITGYSGMSGISYGEYLLDSKMFCAKFNSLGALEWNVTFVPQSFFDTAYGFDLTVDGSYIYVGGFVFLDPTPTQTMMWKYHSNGTLIDYGADIHSNGVIYGVATDSHHSVYDAGADTQMAGPNWYYEAFPYIARSSESLSPSAFLTSGDGWEYIGAVASFPDCQTHPTGGHAIVVDDFDNLYFVGSIFMGEKYDDNVHHLDSFIKTYNLNYQILDYYYAQPGWIRTWGQGHTGSNNNTYNDICNDEIAMDVACSGDNVYVVGFVHQHLSNESAANLFEINFLQRPLHRPNTKIFLLNYKTTGTFTWSLSWGSGNKNDQAYGVAVDSNENIYIAGFTNGTGTSMGDAILLKYSPIPSNTIPGFETLPMTLGMIALVYIYFTFQQPIFIKKIEKGL